MDESASEDYSMKSKSHLEGQICLLLSQVISELRPAPNLCTIFVQEHGRWYERKTQECEQAGCPLRAQIAVHERCEQRKDCSDETANESVCGQSRVGVEQVNVDEVDDSGHEDHDDLQNWLAKARYLFRTMLYLRRSQ